MLKRELLERLEFESKDIELIIEADEKYGSKIEPVSVSFMNLNAFSELSTKEIQRDSPQITPFVVI